MARKIFCDGCGDEISIANVLSVSVTPPAGAQEIKAVTSDLCNGCLATFRRLHLPGAWPRVSPSPVPAD